MPEVRTDPILKHQVIFAPERAQRPLGHAVADPAQFPIRCPFCRGNEGQTPESILEVSGEAGEGWQVRVVPNHFPALDGDSSSSSARMDESSDAFFQYGPNGGRHEVIVTSPDHVLSMHELIEDQFRLIVDTYRSRFRSHRNDDDVRHVVVFQNSGFRAGASVQHVHSQLLAASFVPPLIDRELTAGAAFLKQNGETIWQTILEEELKEGARIVHQTDCFVAFCPFAARFPGETWIVPQRACPDFADATDAEISDLAGVLKTVLQGLDRFLSDPPYNFVIHSAPFRDSRADAYQWHIEIMPRVNGIAGYEVGAGGWINTILPEDAAIRLRRSLS